MYAARHLALVRGWSGGSNSFTRVACLRSSSGFTGDGVSPAAAPVNQAPGPPAPGFSPTLQQQGPPGAQGAPIYNGPHPGGQGPQQFNQGQPGYQPGLGQQFNNGQQQFNHGQQVPLNRPPPPGQQFNYPPPPGQQFNHPPGQYQHNQGPPPGQQYNQQPGQYQQFNQAPPGAPPPHPGQQQFNHPPGPGQYNQGPPPPGTQDSMFNRPPPPGTPTYRPPPPSPPSNRPPRSGRSRPGQEVKSLLKPGEDPLEACLKSFGGEEAMRSTFEAWAKENNKRYKSPEDKEYRYGCWKETATKIHRFNPERHGTLTRMNNYADYTVDELYAVITNRDDKPTH